MRVERLLLVAVAVCSLMSCQAEYDGAREKLFLREYQQIDGVINAIVKENEASAREAQRLLSDDGKGKCLYSKEIYALNASGVLGDHGHVAESNIYVPARAALSDSLWRVVCLTERLEGRWKDVAQRHAGIGWQYLTHASTMVTRTYPWLDEAGYIGPNIDYTKAPQWTMISFDQNPRRETRCTNQYFDHDGMGYVVSCATPIYVGNEMVANMSIDIPVRPYLERMVVDQLGHDGYCRYIVDEKGELVVVHRTSGVNSCDTVDFNGSVAQRWFGHKAQCDGTVRLFDLAHQKTMYLCKKLTRLPGFFIMASSQ